MKDKTVNKLDESLYADIRDHSWRTGQKKTNSKPNQTVDARRADLSETPFFPWNFNNMHRTLQPYHLRLQHSYKHTRKLENQQKINRLMQPTLLAAVSFSGCIHWQNTDYFFLCHSFLTLFAAPPVKYLLRSDRNKKFCSTQIILKENNRTGSLRSGCIQTNFFPGLIFNVVHNFCSGLLYFAMSSSPISSSFSVIS